MNLPIINEQISAREKKKKKEKEKLSPDRP